MRQRASSPGWFHHEDQTAELKLISPPVHWALVHY